jgi:hypothetical protein
LDLKRAKGFVMETFAVYSGASHPVPIPPEFLRFTILSENESDPPIAVDSSTGMVSARRLGHALVQTTFKGISTLTCVSVQENVSSGANRLNCSELVPPGMTLPKTGLEDVPRQLEDMRGVPRVHDTSPKN